MMNASEQPLKAGKRVASPNDKRKRSTDKKRNVPIPFKPKRTASRANKSAALSHHAPEDNPARVTPQRLLTPQRAGSSVAEEENELDGISFQRSQHAP